MKTYFSNKLLHFVNALLALSITLGIFIYVGNEEKKVPLQAKSTSPDSLVQLPQTKETETSSTPTAPTATLTPTPKQPSIVTEWDVKGWKLNCFIEPMLNIHEKGKVVFRIKINENGRLVAIEPINNLSNLSEENIQSFKTTMELELENCLERKNVKIEPISTGTVSFSVNVP